METESDCRVRSVLIDATSRLRACLQGAPAGSGATPYLDALVLLGHAVGAETDRLLADYDRRLSASELRVFGELVSRRCSGEPVSYIRGFKEFYGRNFAVGPGALVPRPDTEPLVECALEAIDATGRGCTVHDACTGSGCVAVTIACERAVLVSASDISGAALHYARANAEAHGVQIDFSQGDLLAPLRSRIESGAEPVHIITANPPYIADNEVVQMTAAGWPEPEVALAGGADGTDVIARLADESRACLADDGWLMVEIGLDQGPAAQDLFTQRGFAEVSVVPDLSGRDRVCKGRWFAR